MKKILFICLGNICRSPMAEFIMKDLVKKANLEKEFFYKQCWNFRRARWRRYALWHQKQACST